MKRYLFVGEKRSPMARKMNVTWQDGRLAAKHLFEALDRIGIEITNCDFKNVFREILAENVVNKSAVREIKRFDGEIIAMGRKVERVLKREGIDHHFIYHPATRGEVRNIDKYCKHVESQLVYLKK